MKINWTLLFIFASLLLGVSPAYPQSASEPEGTPFRISSRGSAFGVQGEFEGTYHITDSSVEIYVSKGTLYVSEHCPYQGRRRINYIRFGLWNHGASGWKIEKRASPLYLYAVMSPREEHHMSDLHFSLPKDIDLDLSKRGLVVEIQEDALDAPPLERGGKGYAFVRSCSDIFVKRELVLASNTKPPCK